MGEVLDAYRADCAVAFFHAISGDFDNHRWMSAGVAVKFRDKFSKPTRSDCLTSHLAFQQSRNEAGVYSLITKQNYYGKPTRLNYDKAFEAFTTDFQRKKI